jgi:hypothetical protein
MDHLEVSINSTIDNPGQFRLVRPEFERRNNLEVELQTYGWASTWLKFIRRPARSSSIYFLHWKNG